MALSSWPALTLQVASERPQSISDVIDYREECRTMGRLEEAQQAHSLIEALKHEEDTRRMKFLLEHQQQQAEALDSDKMAEYEAHLGAWHARFDDLRVRAEEQMGMLQARHEDELEDHRRRLQEAEPRFFWSPTLLHVRRCQEALIQQNEFSKAQKIRAWGDSMEADESEVQLMQMQHKARLDEAKLAEKQAREVDALRKRIASVENEALVAQEREYDKLVKSIQTAKLALQRTHAQEATGLSQALKGWMNPRRSAPASPSLLSPTSQGRVSTAFRASRRPITSYDMPKVYIGGPSGFNALDDGASRRPRESVASISPMGSRRNSFVTTSSSAELPPWPPIVGGAHAPTGFINAFPPPADAAAAAEAFAPLFDTYPSPPPTTTTTTAAAWPPPPPPQLLPAVAANGVLPSASAVSPAATLPAVSHEQRSAPAADVADTSADGPSSHGGPVVDGATTPGVALPPPLDASFRSLSLIVDSPPGSARPSSTSAAAVAAAVAASPRTSLTSPAASASPSAPPLLSPTVALLNNSSSMRASSPHSDASPSSRGSLFSGGTDRGSLFSAGNEGGSVASRHSPTRTASLNTSRGIMSLPTRPVSVGGGWGGSSGGRGDRVLSATGGATGGGLLSFQTDSTSMTSMRREVKPSGPTTQLYGWSNSARRTDESGGSGRRTDNSGSGTPRRGGEELGSARKAADATTPGDV